MLKIKDEVDLKELEKIRISGYSNFYEERLTSIQLSKESCMLVMPDALFDLIQAGLIEKVVE